MNTFAKIKNNLVNEICVAESVEWCEQTLGGVWIATQDDTRVGSYYELGQFFSPTPYPSWHFNYNLPGWEAPVPVPDRPEACVWDEEAGVWIVAPESHRMYALWRYEPVSEDGALYRACSTDETFMPVPTQSDGAKLMEMFPQTENQKYPGVLGHKTLVRIPGELVLTYTYVNDDVKVLSDQLIASHPYATTYTYDELVRNLVEWEWTGAALGNVEWQTGLAGTCLDALGVTAEQRAEILAEQAGPISRFLADVATESI